MLYFLGFHGADWKVPLMDAYHVAGYKAFIHYLLLTFTTTLRLKRLHCLHFVAEETKAERSTMIYHLLITGLCQHHD